MVLVSWRDAGLGASIGGRPQIGAQGVFFMANRFLGRGGDRCPSAPGTSFFRDSCITTDQRKYLLWRIAEKLTCVEKTCISRNFIAVRRLSKSDALPMRIHLPTTVCCSYLVHYFC